MITFILAAGEGRRLRPFTEKNIKPSLPLLNLPLIYYGYFLARKAGSNHFLINKHHLPNQVDRLAQEFETMGSSVQVIDETQALLGSGGALWNARTLLEKHEHFIIANGDEVLIPEDPKILDSLFEYHKKSQAICTLLTCDHPELLKSLKPVWVSEQGQVLGFGMTPKKPEAKPVHYTGYKVFSRRIFEYIPHGSSNIFYDVVTKALDNHENVNTLHLTQSLWHETGNFNSFLSASKDLALNHLSAINERLSYFNKPSLEVQTSHQATLVAPQKTLVPKSTTLEGFIALGEKIKLGENVQLKNTILNSNLRIPDNSMFENQILME